MKNHPFLATGVLLAFTFTNSCFSSSSVFTDARDGQTYITDARDGKTYKVVKIGEQTWMAENLNYKVVENLNYKPNRSICYENDESNCKKHGRLYKWNTAMRVCPSGWRLPKDEEWQNLADFAMDEFTAGKKLKAKSGWEGGNGTDEYGFAALPGGFCYSHDNCYRTDSEGYWWTATQYRGGRAFKRAMYYDKEHVFHLDGNKDSFFSVRCIQN